VADRIRIDFEQVAQLESQLNLNVDQIGDVLNDLDGRMSFNDREWSGEAHDAFVAARAQWERAMRDRQSALAGAAKVLGAANMAFQKAEEAIAKSF
jgi:WXG100 family type VII secretion target